ADAAPEHRGHVSARADASPRELGAVATTAARACVGTHARVLAGRPMAQHRIAGELHMPVVLRQLFVTLEQDMPLRPGPYVGLAHGLREGDGLVTMDMLDIFGYVLL